MADRPTFASVTDTPCKCPYLRQLAGDPSYPIICDQLTGEYQFRYREAGSYGDSMLVIYHCPFCGGAMPKSRRASLFHVIPPGEQKRLNELLDGVTSIRMALRRLGKPDYDNSAGMIIHPASRAGRAPAVQKYRTLHYKKLSRVADVIITQRSNGRASWRLQGKAKKTGRPRGGTS